VLPTLPADRKAMGKGAAVRAMLGPYGRKGVGRAAGRVPDAGAVFRSRRQRELCAE
jgi:hypothetical protein